MLPHYNSGQAHLARGNGGFSGPPPQQQQQGTPFNPSLANSCNMLPHSMGPQPGFMNLANNIVPMQNNHINMPMSQFGFSGPQSNALNTNMAASYPYNGQFYNMGQNVNQVNPNMGFLPGQLFGHNLLNLQQMNQNIGPYGQFCLPNLLNGNQVLPVQMQNPCQGGPNYAFGGFGGTNQAPQAAILQNHAFFRTPNFGNVHSPNQAGQQINLNQQNNVVQGTQGNHIKTGGVYHSSSNKKTSPSKSFIKHPKQGLQPQGGFQKSQFHHNKNSKGKSAFPDRQNRKGASNEKEGKTAHAGSMDKNRETKRPLPLSYTEQEVQLWREGRRKNYPSKINMEKKLSENMINSEAIEREAKARREQLKEILKKQAEMGVEVAEVPPHYLSDSEKQGNERVESRSRKNNRRSQIKFGKRGIYDKKDQFAKRHRSSQKDPSNNHSFNKKEPTLLQKLLSSDIKRDKSRLCQAFRFMVTNSFFRDFPDKPLKFSTVIVKESVVDEGAAEDLSSVAMKGTYGGRDKSKVKTVGKNDDTDCSYSDDYILDDGENAEGIGSPEEEEGEIN